MIVTLGGGVGGSKFLKGLVLSGSEDIVSIVNTGDDIERFGLHISPDIDINMYTLANVIHEQGWGFKDESYRCQKILSDYYQEDCWFNLGDQDFATHIYRTYLMKQNKSLSEITEILCTKMNVPVRLIPMSDQKVTTYVDTTEGRFHIQEYLIQRRSSDHVTGIHYEGAQQALPAAGVIESIGEAETIILAPSNPFVSIGPILSVPGIKEAILNSSAKVVAVSPIVGGEAIKGPLKAMMENMGLEVSPYGIVNGYKDLLDAFVIDQVDAHYKEVIEKEDIKVLIVDTVMNSDSRKADLGKKVVEFTKIL